MIRNGKWKFATYEMEDWPDQLFDLETDSRENKNLAAGKDFPEQVKDFTQLAKEFWKEERRPSFRDRNAHGGHRPSRCPDYVYR